MLLIIIAFLSYNNILSLLLLSCADFCGLDGAAYAACVGVPVNGEYSVCNFIITRVVDDHDQSFLIIYH